LGILQQDFHIVDSDFATMKTVLIEAVENDVKSSIIFAGYCSII